MNQSERAKKEAKQRLWNHSSRERRIASGRPSKADVANAVLTAFLDSSVVNGAAPSAKIVGHLVEAGFRRDKSIVVVDDLVRRHRDRC